MLGARALRRRHLGHRVLWAYNISTSLFYNLEMEEPDLDFWTLADWAWVGGLHHTVFPAWFHGHAMTASQHRFEAEWAYDFMTRHGVTHSFMTPTALKRLAQVENPRVTERPSPLQAKSRARSCGLECKDAKVDSWLIGCRVADQSGPSQR